MTFESDFVVVSPAIARIHSPPQTNMFAEETLDVAFKALAAQPMDSWRCCCSCLERVSTGDLRLKARIFSYPFQSNRAGDTGGWYLGR